MNFLFYVFTGIALAAAQTALAPFIFNVEVLFDLMLPFIIYVILFRPVSESLPLALGLGFVMDSLSAGPSGLLGMVYFSLFFLVTAIRKYLDTETYPVYPLVISGAVLWEALWIMCVKLIFIPGFAPSSESFIVLLKQMFWAAATGPVVLFGVKAGQEKLHAWHRKILEEAGEKSGSF